MKKIVLVFVFLFIIILLSVGVMFFLQREKQPAMQKKADKKVLYWRAPMNPGYRRDKPGKSPMGMDLVPVYATDGSSDGAVTISGAVENNLGVKTAKILRKSVPRHIETVGYVMPDEQRIQHVHTYTDGWIETLTVNRVGEQVKKGQLLLELYSPMIVSAQEELLLALKTQSKNLIDASIKKLETLGVSAEDIAKIKQTHKIIRRIRIYALQDGFVSRLNVREKMYVKPNKDIMTIEDLSTIWVMVDVYERQTAWLNVGQTAIAWFPYLPGKKWQGKVDYIYPSLNTKTHTVQVRLIFPNPNYALKPNMYANIRILAMPVANALAVPQSAVIRTGKGDHVLLSLGKGRYRAQKIKLGTESGDEYIVLDGLNEGDLVVTSAQFLIDSESNLQSDMERMGNKPAHQH